MTLESTLTIAFVEAGAERGRHQPGNYGSRKHIKRHVWIELGEWAKQKAVKLWAERKATQTLSSTHLSDLALFPGTPRGESVPGPYGLCMCSNSNGMSSRYYLFLRYGDIMFTDG